MAEPEVPEVSENPRSLTGYGRVPNAGRPGLTGSVA
jgi:hypothetical protein